MRVDGREAAIWLSINLIGPFIYHWALWRPLNQAPFWSDMPESGTTNLNKLTLAVAFLMLTINLYRFIANSHWRVVYGAIALLNCVTLFGTANIAALLSVRELHFMVTSLLLLLSAPEIDLSPQS